MRREESGRMRVVLDVSSPTSSCHVEPDEKKLNGKNFSIIILAAISWRTLKKNTQTQSSKRLEGRCWGQVIRVTNVRVRPVPIASFPFTTQTRAARQKDKTTSQSYKVRKTHRWAEISRRICNTRYFSTFFSLSFGIPPSIWVLKN